MNRPSNGIDYWDYLDNEDVHVPFEEELNFRAACIRREAAEKESEESDDCDDA